MTIADAALAAVGALRWMGPGELAELRRGGSGPALWRTEARLVAKGLVAERDLARWSPVIQALAILTPKGAPQDRGELHDPGRPWGRVLCDGGDPDWKPDPAAPRPAGLSERRLAQLLAARSEARAVLMMRAARLVAARRGALGVHVGDLARALLHPDAPEIVARPYYARLDGRPASPET